MQMPKSMPNLEEEPQRLTSCAYGANCITPASESLNPHNPARSDVIDLALDHLSQSLKAKQRVGQPHACLCWRWHVKGAAEGGQGGEGEEGGGGKGGQEELGEGREKGGKEKGKRGKMRVEEGWWEQVTGPPSQPPSS